MTRSAAGSAFLGLRAQLALLALCLAALPWVGYRYVKEMERLLLAGQEQNLVATARAVATALHDRPQIMQWPAMGDPALRSQLERELLRLRDSREVADSGQGQAARGGEIAAILQGVERNAARIWVMDRNRRVLSLSGSLRAREDAAQAGLDEPLLRALRPLLAWLIRPPREDFDDALPDDVLGAGREIDDALRGLPGSRVRNTRDERAVIVSAAHPIWSGDQVLGAVVVEETTNPILSLRNRALERLLLLTLLVFAAAAATLFWFATRLSGRIRRLRDEAESAVDAQGRITRLVAGSTAGDEIGDLSRSFSTILEKLGRHHGYLERLAGRLSHELRTPIVVVRSSIENLKAQRLPDEARVYIQRAEEGVARLATLLTRMSEATHLEQSLRSAEREPYDLAEVVDGCVGGYRTAYPNERFDWTRPPGPVEVAGSPDLAAQMLDKLVSNALDFRSPGTPIVLSLAIDGREAVLTVADQGEKLPEGIRDRLFGSMVSDRGRRSDAEPHLGLGLYIARLAAEFHGGRIEALNAAAPPGVAIRVSLPLAAT